MGSEEKMPRQYVLAYWLGHCRCCGKQDDYLIEIQSRIIGLVHVCRRCAEYIGARPVATVK